MVLIKNFVKFSLLKQIVNSSIQSTESSRQIVLKYPCFDSSTCTPYKLSVKTGTYRIECWGSKGKMQLTTLSHPGFGAYTEGIISIKKARTFYVYVGEKGPFNSVRNIENKYNRYIGGGATDVRLNSAEEWHDKISLISRIMVAAGGGGAEWGLSFGGNGGGLTGGASISSKNNPATAQFDEKCDGATQTGGSSCPEYPYGSTKYRAYEGEFGSAGVTQGVTDYGGFGGGGYYGGSSYQFSFAGSGGSSFISGHEGCNSVYNSETIQHTGTPYHYSGLIFYDTLMIPGNNTMPLPDGGFGVFDDDRGGAFRITLLAYNGISCRRKEPSFSFVFFIDIAFSYKYSK